MEIEKWRANVICYACRETFNILNISLIAIPQCNEPLVVCSICYNKTKETNSRMIDINPCLYHPQQMFTVYMN